MRCAWITLGLGNPGQEYSRTRHNAGINALKILLSGLCGACYEVTGKNYSALLSGDCLFAVQRCYMNESDRIVEELRQKGVTADQWLILHDDLSIGLGRIKVARAGSSAGHRGVEAISRGLGSDRFARIKIGIAPPGEVHRSLLKDFVLSPFSEEEGESLLPALVAAASAAVCVVQEGADRAMDLFHGDRTGVGS